MPKTHHRIDQFTEKALAEFPHTRDNDVDLHMKVIELAEGIVIHDSVPVYLLKHYKYDTVNRARQVMQNKYHLYDASDKVKIRRAKHCKTMRNFFRNLFW